MTARPWGAVAELAGQQYGVVSLAQLRALGIPRTTVEAWHERRRLVSVHGNVYAVGHASLVRDGRYLAAVLACGDDAALSHRSAAALWEMRPTSATRIEITSPTRTGRRKRDLRVHLGAVPADERTEVNSIPCTTVARTLLDLAAVTGPRAVEAAVEASERLGLFDLRQVALLLGRHAGRRGVGRLRQAIAAFDEELVRVRSETEARFFRLCVDSGLPKPLVNRQVEADGERFEVDFYWPDHGLIVEVDSPFHDTTAARPRDAARDATLKGAGWIVFRWRWHEIVERPSLVVGTLRGTLLHPPFPPRTARFPPLWGESDRSAGR